MLCCVVLYGTVLCYTALYFTVLYCTELYSTYGLHCGFYLIFLQLSQEKLKVKTLDLRDSEMRCGELERDVESSYMKVPYVLMIMYDCASHKCMTGFFCGASVFFRVFVRD